MSGFTHTLVVGWDNFVAGATRVGTDIGSAIGPAGVAVFILAAVVLIGFAVDAIVFRPGNELRQALEPYRLHAPPPSRSAAEAAGPGAADVVTVPFLRRLADFFAGFAEERGQSRALELRLVRAGLPIGTGEFLLVSAVVVVLLAVLGLALEGILGLLVGAVVGVFAVIAAAEFLAQRRSRAFDAQLPDVLKLLAASLRAGFSLVQGLDAVTRQVKEPMHGELARSLAEIRLGAAPEDALSEVPARMGSRDFGWTVIAIRIQREVGGNLSEILETVAATMVERERLRREVRTLTAEGRISALILGLLPFFLGIYLFIVDHSYLSLLFTTFPGEIALLIGLMLEVLGVWWMIKLVNIEI